MNKEWRDKSYINICDIPVKCFNLETMTYYTKQFLMGENNACKIIFENRKEKYYGVLLEDYNIACEIPISTFETVFKEI